MLQTWNLYERGELVLLVDLSLNGDFDAEEACKYLKIGLLCTQDSPKLRPSMSTVVKMLTGEMSIEDRKITKPGLISDFMDLKVKNPEEKKGNREGCLLIVYPLDQTSLEIQQCHLKPQLLHLQPSLHNMTGILSHL